MALVRNGRVLFNSVPAGYPEPGKTTIYDTTQTIDLDNVPLNGGFLVKTLDVSIDPYMRGRMRDASKQSYSPAFIIGQPINGYGIGVVLRSELAGVKPGDHVYGTFDYQNYSIRKTLDGLQIIDNKHNLPWAAFIGVCGMPGKTAYMAWKEYSRAKKGETAFITTGGGPVGSFVIQLAKLDGLKVIASAGSEEKVKFMKEIGADVAFNYKTTNTLDVLRKEGPIDVYWDNVGGETLDAALDAANVGARFIECGMIAGYNTGGQPVKNMMYVVGKSISIHGFIVSRIEHKYNEEFYERVPSMVAKGELQYRDDVFQGLQEVGNAILAVQKGTNKAKAVVHVADE